MKYPARAFRLGGVLEDTAWGLYFRFHIGWRWTLGLESGYNTGCAGWFVFSEALY